jgi:Tol biopolymer transport system component
MEDAQPVGGRSIAAWRTSTRKESSTWLALVLLTSCRAQTTLAFQSDRSGVDQIYTMTPDGGNLTQVTSGSVENWQPGVGPLGARLAYINQPKAGGDIWTISGDGTMPTQVLTGMSARAPRWNRKKSEIAFSGGSDGGAPDIWIMAADGFNLRRLTSDPGADIEPNFSPDGTRIVFTSTRNGKSDIYVMNVDGSGQTRLTTSPENDAEGSFSPDGSKIAFWTNRDGNGEIYWMDSDGGNQVNLTNVPTFEFEPVFSPTTNEIAFSSLRDGDWEIYVLELVGGAVRKLTDNSVVDRAPDWR